MLKPSQTFETSPREVQEIPEGAQSGSSGTTAVKVAFKARSSVLSTRTEAKYEERLAEEYDVTESPGFVVSGIQIQ